jgi:hypothetical protein
VVFGEKGAASHIEVICRIRGIDLVPADVSVSGRMRSEEIPLDIVSTFQVSVAAASELDGVDLSNVSSVFIRLEHLLYESVWEDPSLLDSSRRDDLQRSLLNQLEEICAELPNDANLLVRGLDLRSDDTLLGALRHPRNEANPELGLHGASWLLDNSQWVDFESRVLKRVDRDRLTYGVPFVRSLSELERFRTRFGKALPELIPFLETPASVLEFAHEATEGVHQVAIGLKDLAQFFFAADRANPSVAQHFDFASPLIVDFVAGAVESLNSRGVATSIYQQAEFIRVYAERLGAIAWLPSVGIAALRQNGSTHGEVQVPSPPH